MSTKIRLAVDLNNILGIENKAILFQRLLNAHDPFHLSVAQRNLTILAPVKLYPVTSLVLGHVARSVGSTKHV